jgi:putative selenium metabolism hydrolase
MIELLQSLVSTPSMSGDEGAVIQLCADAMRELGYDVEIDEFGNALGVLGEGPSRLLFDGHADTVAANPAWTRDPLDAAVQGERLHGLGSTDMKGPLAALIHGVADAARNGRLHATVGVSITTLEEVMEGAALAPVLERFRPDAVVIAEPSGGRLALAQKGRAELLIEVKGRAAHAAFPEVGANALVGAAAVILALEERLAPTDSELGDGLLVVTEGASEPLPGISVVPALTRLRLDRRTLPGETPTDVLEELRPYLGAATRAGASASVSISDGEVITYTGASLPARRFLPAWRADRAHPFVAGALAVLPEGPPAHFCTNGSRSASLDIPTIIFGPGDPRDAHQADESVSLADLETARRGYTILATLDPA